MKNMRIVLIGLSILFLVGCVHEDDENSNGFINLKTDGVKTELEGRWVKDCEYEPYQSYESFELTIIGRNYSVVSSISQDSDCRVKDMRFEVVGTFEVGEEITLSSGKIVKEIDRQDSKILFIPLNDDVVDTFNNFDLCETTWKKNVGVDVSSCSEFDEDYKVHYDIFMISGRKLYFGDDDHGDKTTKYDRPTQLESDYLQKI